MDNGRAPLSCLVAQGLWPVWGFDSLSQALQETKEEGMRVDEHNKAISNQDWKYFAGKNRVKAIRMYCERYGVPPMEGARAVDLYLRKRSEEAQG